MYQKKNRIFYIALLIPALALLVLFFLTPVVQSFLLSFTDSYGMRNNFNFIGLSNYIEAFHDKSFTQTIGNTLKYTAFSVIVGNLLSLTLALLLDSKIHGNNLFRTIFFIPNIMSLLVVGYIWMFVYTKAIPALLQKLNGTSVAILGNRKFVIYALAIVGIWNAAGYYMVIYIASLQSISSDLIEAARVDGASAWQVLRYVKIPMISPTIITCLILSVSAHMKAFELPYTMTSGGPLGASATMVFKIYRTAFNADRNGYAAAQSIVLFIIIGSISLVLSYIMKKREAKLQ